MISKQIVALRAAMKNAKITAFIIPSADPHQSEYVSEYWKIRQYFSGFTGTAGTLVVTEKEVALWTDSRYFLQFEDECKGTEVTLHKQSIPHAPEHIPWLCNILPEGAVIGLDYSQFSKAQVDYLKEIASKKSIRIQNEDKIVNDVWLNRPTLPNEAVCHHKIEFSGASTVSKIEKIKAELTSKNADYYFFSSLDDIAWLFNIRGEDVGFTPLVIAYAIISKTETVLFCNRNRFSDSILLNFEKEHISVKKYNEAFSFLSEVLENKTIITDASILSYAVFNVVKASFIYEKSLVKELKAVKNETEISGTKNGMLKDGIALTRFFIWLDKELEERAISEYEIGKKLENFRKEQKDYVSESFATIVGYKGNGAIIHYTAPEYTSSLVKKEGILLIDSGAQYKDATTDITRTIWLGGKIPLEIKKAYTGVLKGYISLEQLQFPKGTTGVQIDAFARMHLWKQGMNYPHGTGHGIGSFGMVHEPAQGFASSTVTERGSTVHKENQLTTIEPGCYKTNEFGIRIENVIVSKKIQETYFGTFLGFEPLTLFPIDRQMILVDELSKNDVDWFNSYHDLVFKKLSPLLDADEKKWLKEMCKAI